MIKYLRNKLDPQLAHPLLDVYLHGVLAAMVLPMLLILGLIGMVLYRVLYLQVKPIPEMSDAVLVVVMLLVMISPIPSGLTCGYWRYRWLKSHGKLQNEKTSG